MLSFNAFTSSPAAVFQISAPVACTSKRPSRQACNMLIKEYQGHQESLAVAFIPWSRFFLTIAKAWLGKDWQGGSQYLVLQSKARTKLDERRRGSLLLVSFSGADCPPPKGCVLIFACTLYPPLGSGNVEELVLGTDGAIVGVLGGVFLRTGEDV